MIPLFSQALLSVVEAVVEEVEGLVDASIEKHESGVLRGSTLHVSKREFEFGAGFEGVAGEESVLVEVSESGAIMGFRGSGQY